MISQQLPVILLIRGESLCPRRQKKRENLQLFIMPNKPNSKPAKIVVSDSIIRTKNNELRTAEGKNKPKQTHLFHQLSVNLRVLCGKIHDFAIDYHAVAQIVY